MYYIFYTAYLKRGDFNVFMVDWHNLAPYPCYLTSMMFTLIVSRCTAQLYERIIDSGTTPSNIHCTGHSLGAHICGQMTNYLREKQHKIFGEYRQLAVTFLWKGLGSRIISKPQKEFYNK